VKGGGVWACSSTGGVWACSSTGRVWTCALIGEGRDSGTAGAALISGCEIAAGGVGGLSSGEFGPDRSADVGCCGSLICAGGTVTCGVMIGTALFGCASAFGGGMEAATGSKLNGLLCSLGGGRGVTGEID
jgi:hypothetical protein